MNIHEPAELARLTFRQEGKFLVADLVYTDDVDEGRRLGSIHIGLARIQDIRELFVDTMRHSAAHILRVALGQDISFSDPLPLPESERSGNA